MAKTARAASLGYASFAGPGGPFLPSTSPHPSLSLLHPAAVAWCSHRLDHRSVGLQADLATQAADDASKPGDCQPLAFPLWHQKKKNKNNLLSDFVGTKPIECCEISVKSHSKGQTMRRPRWDPLGKFRRAVGRFSSSSCFSSTCP